MHGSWSGGIWKSCDTPAGQSYWCPETFHHLVDCPVCKFGTLGEKDICCDCGREAYYSESWTKARLEREKLEREEKERHAAANPPKPAKKRKEHHWTDTAKAYPFPEWKPSPVPEWKPTYVMVKEHGQGFIIDQDDVSVWVQLLHNGNIVRLAKSLQVEKL